MSASSKKKLRKEQAAAELTDKQRQAKKEAKKLKAYTITFVVIMVLVVCIAVGTMVVTSINRSGILDRNTTAVTVGNHKINSVELSYYYIDGINNYYNSLYSSWGDYVSYYLQMIGLDLTQPLSNSVYNEEDGTSWADYFVSAAIDSAASTYALYDAAMAEGFSLSEEDQATIDNVMNNLPIYAVYYGYGSVEEYLKGTYGNGASEESFRNYYELNYLADSYYLAHQESLSYDDETIRAYDAEHKLDYNAYSYAVYSLTASDFLEGGTEDEDGTVTYSDEEKAASVAAAKAAADSLLGAASVEEFDEAIADLDINSEKESAASTKYDSTFYSSISSSYKDWVTDSSHKAGDMTVIANETTTTADDGTETTTTNGYYVIFFESSTDNTMPLANVRHILIGFEGGTTDDSGNTVYSDEEKADALEEAEALLQEWKDGEATEDSFAALANEHSTDTGSNTNGGLYEDIYPGQMVTNFNDWCFDETRQPGDTGIVESTFGYHVIYYVGDSDTTYRDYMITNDLVTEEMNEWYTALVDAISITDGNTSRINRDLVLSSASTI